MPKLIFNDPETDQEVSLTIGDTQPEVTVGRNPGNTLRVNNPSISRRHAKIVWENNEVTLYDLDSSNGSYVNGHRVRSQVLVNEDRLRIGEFPLLFMDESDSATAEVSPDVIDSVLQAGGHKQTNLGGFNAGPPEPPPTPEAFGGPVQSHDGMFDLDPVSEEPAFGQPSGYGPESYGFSNSAPTFDPPSFNDGFQNSAFPAPPPQEWGEDEPIELEPDLSDLDSDGTSNEADVFGLASSSAFGDDLGAAPSIGEEDLDTRNAAPGEIASGLANFVRSDSEENFDSTVEQSVENFMALRAAAAGSGDVVDLQRQIDELRRERDELSDMLQNRAGDAGAASQLQIERLRKERDRLSDERRNLMRQLNDTKKALDEAPSAQAIGEAREQISDLQAAMADLEADRNNLQALSAQKDERIDALQAQVDELRAAASDRDFAHQQSAELGEQLSSANENLAEFQAEMQRLRDEVGTLNERLNGAVTEIEQLDQEVADRDEKIASYTDLIDSLNLNLSEREAQADELRVALEEALADVEAQAQRLELVEAELEQRPVADEVVDLRSRLAAVEAERDTLTTERDSLREVKAELEQKVSEGAKLVDAINERYSKIGSEFDAIKRERDELKEERVAFARETDYLQVERRRMTDELEDLRKKVKSADKETKRKKQIFDELSGDLRNLVKENNALQDKVSTLEKRVGESPSPEHVAELEASLKAAREQVADLEQDNAGLTRDLGKFVEEKSALEERAVALAAELDVALANAASGAEASEALHALREERDTLKSRVEELEPQLEALAANLAELEELRGAVETSMSRIAELEDQLASASEAAAGAQKAAELQKKLEEAETTLAAIILERDKLEDDLMKAKKK
ncbi:MAG: FHA domain-containing protein [bacterium]